MSSAEAVPSPATAAPVTESILFYQRPEALTPERHGNLHLKKEGDFGFAKTTNSVAITATEFRTGEAVVFTKGKLVDPIRASCAYPGMFLPVEIDGRSYIDGMLAYAVPTTPLRQMGAERVIGIYLSAHWNNAKPPRHLFEVIGQCFSIAQAKLAESWKKDANLVIEPNVEGFAYDCFERTPELIAAGEAAMRAALPQVRAMLELPKVRKETTAPVPRTPVAAAG